MSTKRAEQGVRHLPPTWLKELPSVEVCDVLCVMKVCKLIQEVQKRSLEVCLLAPKMDELESGSKFRTISLRNLIVWSSKLGFRSSRINLGAFIMFFKSPLNRNIRGCFISEEDVGHFFDLHPRNVASIFELALNRSRIHSLNIQTHGKSSKTFNTNFRITNAPINQVKFWLSRDHLGQKSHPINGVSLCFSGLAMAQLQTTLESL